MNNRNLTIKQAAVNKRWLRLTLSALALTIILTVAPLSLHAQTTTRYVYDDNGRLHAVIAPNGEANIYEYDATGNFTAIRRNTSNTLEVLDFTPREGVPGNQVTIIGTGFGAGVNAVAFNGTAAQIITTNAPVVVVTVPNGATTGPISVTTPQGATTTVQPFVVKGVQLTPLSASLNPGQTLQFNAVVFPLGSNQNVTWSVNDVDGGNTTVGTITSNGLYTAPAAFFTSIIVRAVSVADPLLLNEARVMVGPIDSTTTMAALMPSVAILRQPPPDPPAMISAIGAGVLIQRELPPNQPAMLAASGAGVSTTTGPFISAISPNQIARGATLTVTISGANLSGVSTIRFSNGSGGLDSNITASNLNVNGGGTSLTATLTVSASAAVGRRLVVVSTANGNSLTFDNGLNSIEIVP